MYEDLLDKTTNPFCKLLTYVTMWPKLKLISYMNQIKILLIYMFYTIFRSFWNQFIVLSISILELWPFPALPPQKKKEEKKKIKQIGSVLSTFRKEIMFTGLSIFSHHWFMGLTDYVSKIILNHVWECEQFWYMFR